MKLRLNLHFTDALVFSDFVPMTEEDAIKVTLQEGKYHAKIYIADPKKQLEHYELLSKDWESYLSSIFYCLGLTVYIDVKTVSQQIVTALETDQPTEETEYFGREVYKVVFGLQRAMESYFRNVNLQHWVDQTNYDPQDYQNYLDSCEATWLDSDDQWRKLRVAMKPRKTLSVIWRNGVTRNEWHELESFIDENKSPPIQRILLANSLRHLDQGNGRVAILEAIIAVEAVAKSLFTHVVVHRSAFPQIKESLFENLFREAGLSLAAEISLKMVKNAVGLTDDEIDIVLTTIKQRNAIVHKGMLNIEINEARKHIIVIQHVILKIEQWLDAESDNSKPES